MSLSLILSGSGASGSINMSSSDTFSIDNDEYRLILSIVLSFNCNVDWPIELGWVLIANAVNGRRRKAYTSDSTCYLSDLSFLEISIDKSLNWLG